MGLLHRLKALNDPAIKRWQASQERWAEIVGIGSSIGPLAVLRLEIHDAGLPVETVEQRVRVPRGVTPTVGQHVAFHENSNGGQRRSFIIDWDKAPQYGEADEQAAAAQEVVDRFVPALPAVETATPEQAMDPDVQQATLERMRDAGQIPQAEYERMAADVQRYRESPQDEMDPAVHLARLEADRAAGRVSDADYAARRRDLDNWVANLQRLK